MASKIQQHVVYSSSTRSDPVESVPGRTGTLVPVLSQHDPSTLPSHHLNVTVSVQDKDEESRTSVRCAVDKAVLDTANYSEDFISFTMIETMHVCHEALKAITVCSGLDGHCYLNNEIIDLNLKFSSYDGECHTIPLILRVNRKTDIDFSLRRKTVNKYDFMSLTPFAFGISPELRAENEKKSDTRHREFEEREAISKLDPLHMHKYTGCMISEGYEPEEPEVRVYYPNL